MSQFQIESIINNIDGDEYSQKTFLMLMPYHKNYPFQSELEVAEAFINFIHNSGN